MFIKKLTKTKTKIISNTKISQHPWPSGIAGRPTFAFSPLPMSCIKPNKVSRKLRLLFNGLFAVR